MEFYLLRFGEDRDSSALQGCKTLMGELRGTAVSSFVDVKAGEG